VAGRAQQTSLTRLPARRLSPLLASACRSLHRLALALALALARQRPTSIRERRPRTLKNSSDTARTFAPLLGSFRQAKPRPPGCRYRWVSVRREARSWAEGPPVHVIDQLRNVQRSDVESCKPPIHRICGEKCLEVRRRGDGPPTGTARCPHPSPPGIPAHPARFLQARAVGAAKSGVPLTQRDAL
jgi:hypothetical protein